MKNSDPAPAMPGTGAALVSSRVGFVILVLLVTGVGWWMAVQRQRLDAPAQIPAADVAAPVGFRSDLLFLPDEPLLGFVQIPAGAFIMGSNPAADRQAYENERWSDSLRQGTPELETFYLSRFEVTVAQLRAWLVDTGADPQRAAYGAEATHPAVNVTWSEALAFARWLQQSLLDHPTTPVELRTLLQSGWVIGLPSEAQWEKAARGTDGRIFPWGNQLRTDRANFAAAGVRPVGSQPCPECSYGLLDMSGNVWEMTRSPYRPYPFRDGLGEVDLSADALWVMRGGSFSDTDANIRTAVRGGVDPGVRSGTIGFRLALSPPLPR